MRENGFVCYAGHDWWYHNRNHFDAQMVRYFAKHGSALYINSIVMQKVNISQSGKFGMLNEAKGKAENNSTTFN